MNPSKTYLRQEMRKYLSTVPDASPEEIADLKIWVAQGNDPYGNPWHIADEHGWEMQYIRALRAEHDLIENVELGRLILPILLLNLTCFKRGLCPRTPGV
jgi:hypothetical protein